MPSMDFMDSLVQGNRKVPFDVSFLSELSLGLARRDSLIIEFINDTGVGAQFSGNVCEVARSEIIDLISKRYILRGNIVGHEAGSLYYTVRDHQNLHSKFTDADVLNILRGGNRSFLGEPRWQGKSDVEKCNYFNDFFAYLRRNCYAGDKIFGSFRPVVALKIDSRLAHQSYLPKFMRCLTGTASHPGCLVHMIMSLEIGTEVRQVTCFDRYIANIPGTGFAAVNASDPPCVAFAPEKVLSFKMVT
jgi:hypothetical protein